jgi:hypothetical protein
VKLSLLARCGVLSALDRLSQDRISSRAASTSARSRSFPSPGGRAKACLIVSRMGPTENAGLWTAASAVSRQTKLPALGARASKFPEPNKLFSTLA